MKQIVGIRFSEYGQVLACLHDPGDGAGASVFLTVGAGAMADTEHGPGFGRVVWQRPVTDDFRDLPLEELVDAAPEEEEKEEDASAAEDKGSAPLPSARPASPAEARTGEDNEKISREAWTYCRRCIADRGLDMKLVDVETLFDRSKMIFYFTAPTRIDFRELVKDLVRQYRTRIELRQIGVRHETQMLGALGNCGMVCCCRRFLHKFAPVTIKMAKEQNLFLNPTKISGICGRLLCCLSYEQENYDAFHRNCPKLGKRYQTDQGPMRALRGNMFRNTVVALADGGQETEYTLEEWQALHPHRAETPSCPAPREQRPFQELMVVSAAPDTLDDDLAGLEELPDEQESAPAFMRSEPGRPDLMRPAPPQAAAPRGDGSRPPAEGNEGRSRRKRRRRPPTQGRDEAAGPNSPSENPTDASRS